MKRWLTPGLIVKAAAVTLLLGVFAGAVYKYSYTVRRTVRAILLAPSQRPAALGAGGPATDLILCDPMGLVADAAGNVYLSDRGRGARGRTVWRVDRSGVATAVVGTGRRGKARGTSAARISLAMPEGIDLDPQGRLYVADAGNNLILRIDRDGRVERFAGTGARSGSGPLGDGGPALHAQLNRPSDIRFDSRGHLYVADVNAHRIRRIGPDGRIETVAGTGTQGFGGDGGPAVAALLDTPWGIAVDRADRLLIADSENHRIRRVGHDGTIETIAGNGEKGLTGPGSHDALAVAFDAPQGLWDSGQELYIVDEHNHLVWTLHDDGSLARAIGTGTQGLASEGTVALRASLNDPEGILTLADGSLLVADGDNGRVLRVAPDGTVHVFAGRGDTSLCTG